MYERTNLTSGATERKIVHLSCNRADCPRCQQRKRRKLLTRIRNIRWRGYVCLWTLTTDPKVLDPEEALRTIQHRWHLVHRELLRMQPRLRYLKVIELTKSGLPHIHFLTDMFIEFHQLRSIVTRFHFGEQLNFEKVDTHRAVGYACKYLTKSFTAVHQIRKFTSRIWTASNFFVPRIEYFDPQGAWTLIEVLIDTFGDFCRRFYQINAPPSATLGH